MSMDINSSQCFMAAVEAQHEGRELSRLEASVIGQWLADLDGFDTYYKPRSQADALSAALADNNEHARWDERIAWDMLGTYMLNTPNYGESR